MSEWTTDRRPTAEDADNDYVWVTTEHGKVRLQRWDRVGERPWMPRARPEPYVKPRRFTVCGNEKWWRVFDIKMREYSSPMFPTREAAERIAAIYEEVMP